MPLAVQIDNGRVVEASISEWVVAIVESLKPEHLALVCTKVEAIKARPKLVAPNGQMTRMT